MVIQLQMVQNKLKKDGFELATKDNINIFSYGKVIKFDILLNLDHRGGNWAWKKAVAEE